MSYERKWAAVPPQAFTVNGGQFGLVTVASTAGFRVKQSAYLKNNSDQNLSVQVKVVLSSTTLIVGYPDNQIANWKPINLSSWTVASGASIGAEWQNKNNISVEDINKAVYEADPVVAIRTLGVDQFGNPWSLTNPLPVAFDGDISIGVVEVKGTNGNFIEPNMDGSINVNVVSVPVAGNVVINQYGEANSVASGITTNVVQYVTPAGLTQAILQRISVSGENIAKWTVFINGTQIDTRRTFWGSSLSEYFEFTTGGSDGVMLSPGDIVTVKVLHTRPYVGDFEGRIQVYQIA